MIAVIDFKFPTGGAAAVRHGLDDLPSAFVRIGKSHRRRTVGCDRDRFHGSITDPVRIVAGFLPSVVSTGRQTRGSDRSIPTCSKGRAGDRAGAGGIRVQSDLPPAQILPRVGFLHQFYAAGIPFVCKADRRRRASRYRHLLRICTGTVIHLTDGAVRMSQLLDVVSPRRQTGSGNLAAIVSGMRAGYQFRTGGIRIDTEFPSGEVLSILGGFGQADTSRPWSGFQLEVGIEAACGRGVQRYRRLVAGTGHIPDSVCGVRCGGQIPGRFVYRRLGDIPGLGDVQRVPALVKFRTIPIRKGKVGQDAVAVRYCGFLPCQGDGGGAADGSAGKAGYLLCPLNCVYQSVIFGRKIRNAGFPCVVKDIARGAARIHGIALECGRVTQAADDLINKELGSDPQGDIGVAVFFRGGHADRVIPHLVTVQENQANGLPVIFRHGVPHIAARRAAAAIQSHAPVNGVSGGTGAVAAPWFNAVQRFVRIGNTAIPGEMPAQVFDIGCPGSAGAIGFVLAGNLRLQDGGIIAIVRIVKQQDAFLGTADRHYSIIILRVSDVWWFCRLRGFSRVNTICPLGDCFLGLGAVCT